MRTYRLAGERGSYSAEGIDRLLAVTRELYGERAILTWAPDGAVGSVHAGGRTVSRVHVVAVDGADAWVETLRPVGPRRFAPLALVARR